VPLGPQYGAATPQRPSLTTPLFPHDRSGGKLKSYKWKYGKRNPIDESTKENENDVEVLVGKEIDDNDPFFADADDHNQGEKNEEGEGAMEGSNKPDKLFYSSGSDSDGRKDNGTKRRNKDKDLLLTKQDISTTEKKRNREGIESKTDNEQGIKKKKKE
jgi:hypothetical protein